MRNEAAKPEAGWDQIAPELEAAVERLGRADREAVLLRFYEQKPLAEVGCVLGVSEDAARKRVERAVGRLREKLAAKGVEVEAGALAGMVLGHTGDGDAPALVERVIQGMGSGTAKRIATGASWMMTAKAGTATVLLLAVTAIAWAAFPQVADAEQGGATRRVAAGQAVSLPRRGCGRADPRYTHA